MNKNIFDRVRALNLPLGEYALFGSAPLGIRGIRECRDIDIIVTTASWDERIAAGSWELRKNDAGREYLGRDVFELWKEWYPGNWDIKKLIIDAEIIDGLPFVQMKEVIKWKRMKGQEKDLRDLELLKEAGYM